MPRILYDIKDVSKVIVEPLPVTLVQNINLQISTHEFIGIIGPSGSGKSSLLYLLGLLDQPTSGYFHFEGIDALTLSKQQLAQIRLEKIGFIFQFHFLLPELTSLDNVLLPMRRLGQRSEQFMTAKALELFDILMLNNEVYKTPGQLSGGQRQRVAIARALANDPQIILADEPTGNLDTHNSDRVFDIFKNLVTEYGKTILVVTHNPDLVARTLRQLTIIDGELV
jgi:lipoprotein-releasing system ATP-binding protein